MRGWLGVTAVALGWVGAAFCAPGEDNSFSIDPSLLNQIYEQTTRVEGQRESYTLEVSPSIGVLVPSKLTLVNEYFTVPYSANVSSLPAAMMKVGFPLGRSGPWAFQGTVSLGYGYVEGLYDIQSQAGAQRTTLIRLHRLPVLVSAQVAFEGLGTIVPFLAVGGGAQWFYQDGVLDGVSRGFWVPQVRVQPGVRISLGSGNSTFQGFTLGGAWEKGLSSTQAFEGWSVEGSVDFLL